MSDRRVMNTPFVLIVRDGWGENPNREHRDFNAIELAVTPVDDRLRAEYPSTLIHTSGEAVGVPEGTTGNSEVGHQNLGAGRIVFQDSVRISRAIRDESFFVNETLRAAVEAATGDDGARVHLMGIASDAGVHGRLEHLYACLELCRRRGVAQDRVLIHLFTDGRDTGPFTGRGFIESVETKTSELGVGRIASVIGRYWAMDRDNRWERTERAYNALTGRDLERDSTRIAPSAADAVDRYYDDPVSDNMKGDEFIEPTLIGADLDDAMSTRIRPGDSVIFYNYRGDRPRQLVRALAVDVFYNEVPPSPDSGSKGFDRGPKLGVRMVTMASYDRTLEPYVEVAFPRPPKLDDIAGAYLSELGLTQFRCAETEKYAHVTFFFNDYREEPFEGEHRQIVQSPKVKTYDLEPEMSAAGVRDAVLERLRSDDCEAFVVVNFANPDMVGHTGNLDAAVKAVEYVDGCVGAIVDATLERGGSLIVTADHGNAEQMFDPETNGPHTAHTPYDVRLFVVGGPFTGRSLRSNGKLADVIPTAFEMIGLAKPEAMTGESLLA
ncbi:MAG: 2,3-bisphosphoglycerate-independent phosphoglycerate mutase [Phycisphaerales bacterium]